MQPASSPLPYICVSPASPERQYPEPYSPFPSAEADPEGDDGFRAKHLTPPPLATASPRHSSPLRPANCPIPKGLNREQFDLLLKASRERKALLGSQKTVDLRKELALKNQRNKQLERRARFLSKVKEPPSPTAVSTPKTPPESPSIFHCSLPSPGLESPLSVFESAAKGPGNLLDIDSDTHHGWVEQVEFRLPIGKQSNAATKAKARPATQTKSKKVAPSLDEITARLSGSPFARSSAKPTESTDKHSNSSSRLPNFLKTARRLSSTPAPAESRPKINVGRLHLPVRSLSMNDALVVTPPPRFDPPQSPVPCTPNLEVKISVVPRTSSVALVALNETNLRAFGRSYTARDMMQTLKRRSSPPSGLGHDAGTQTSIKLKRHSAPAELQVSGRAGFDHQVLSMPGGF
ncbi:hypothetical protein HYDPIDRAFT_179421 [Hydnomerulius pinastri MD-312]|nr:hypothetical protein HYDPIDRAFT_179421 [Hydnomerulius pinastri MD-312]